MIRSFSFVKAFHLHVKSLVAWLYGREMAFFVSLLMLSWFYPFIRPLSQFSKKLFIPKIHPTLFYVFDIQYEIYSNVIIHPIWRLIHTVVRICTINPPIICYFNNAPQRHLPNIKAHEKLPELTTMTFLIYKINRDIQYYHMSTIISSKSWRFSQFNRMHKKRNPINSIKKQRRTMKMNRVR